MSVPLPHTSLILVLFVVLIVVALSGAIWLLLVALAPLATTILTTTAVPVEISTIALVNATVSAAVESLGVTESRFLLEIVTSDFDWKAVLAATAAVKELDIAVLQIERHIMVIKFGSTTAAIVRTMNACGRVSRFKKLQRE